MTDSTPYILVLYYSRHGAVKNLAEEIASGIESADIEARLRTVLPITDGTKNIVSETDDLYATLDDLRHCNGLALGSPTRFGNMAAPMKYFLDTTTEIWLSGSLVDKPAAVFSSTSSLHGGQESTLLTMMLPLFHHGMMIIGSPYTEQDLHTTKTGGTPYGATHVTNGDDNTPLSAEEKRLAQNLGKRLAKIAIQSIN